MRFRMLFLALTAVAAVGLGATGSIAASKQGLVEYQFRGELAATPPPNSSSLLVDVAGGNQRALRLLVGQPSGSGLRGRLATPSTCAGCTAFRPSSSRATWPRATSSSSASAHRAARRSPRSKLSAAKVVADHGPNPGRASEAALAVPGDAQRARRERSSRRPRPGREPSRAEGDARPGAGSVVRLRPAHGVHQVAGPRAHAHLSEPAHRRRPDQRPDPRPRQLVARTGRGHAGEPRRRARARF